MEISKQQANYKDKSTNEENCASCKSFMPIKPPQCTIVKGTISPKGWCKFFELKDTLKKANEMTDFNFFLPISKVDKDKRIVYGYASTPTKDSDGEIVTLDAIKAALPGYMEYANIREMHQLKAVGTAEEANVDQKGLFISAKIVDDTAWKKCDTGVYKGFSIGGKKLAKDGDKITKIDLSEISVVDRPANPDARFTIAKSQKSLGTAQGYLVKQKPQMSEAGKALIKVAKVLAKADPPAAHDGFSLPAKVQTNTPSDPKVAELGPNDFRPNENETRKTEETIEATTTETPCLKHRKIGCKKCAAKAIKKLDKEPYGDVEYADPGYQEDKKKRYPIDTEEHIRAAWNYINKPKNALKYGANVNKVRSKIIAAWKSKIDKSGPPSVEANKSIKSDFMSLLDLENNSPLVLRKAKDTGLKKGMSTAGNLSYVFDTLRDVQRSLLMEGKREGGDMKDHALADRVGALAKEISSIIAQKATHEGGEATTLSDADDSYVKQVLGKAITMNDGENIVENSGDPLANAVAQLVKRAAMPSKAARMKMAMDECAKSRKAAKAARKAIDDCHKMHKAAYIAKMGKAAKGNKDDNKPDMSDEFDHMGAMSKLQKAYQECEKARTFVKAAFEQMEKVTRAGQRGQETGDPMSGVYEVPPGVKDLTPDDMATASPGGMEHGTMPPIYPTDGSVYPGKANQSGDLRKFAKNGVMSVEVAELIMEKAKADGELEALRRMPAQGRPRPYAFDMTKVNNGFGAQNLTKSLFDGVDANAIGSGDEQAHTAATAKVIGNFLTSGSFGKSILDPTFKGAAGAK